MKDRAPASESQNLKIEIVETLDQLVRAEHNYKRISGHFTKLINRIPYAIPASLADHVAFNVQEAGDRLLITATTEDHGQTRDQITMDQGFQVHANFPMPAPRTEYLRSLAYRQLEKIRDTGQTDSPAESVFQGYFKFQIQDDPQKPVVLASGIRAPVLGMKVELPIEPKENKAAGNLLSEVIQKFPKIRGFQTGENAYKNSAQTGRNSDLVIEPIE